MKKMLLLVLIVIGSACLLQAQQEVNEKDIVLSNELQLGWHGSMNLVVLEAPSGDYFLEGSNGHLKFKNESLDSIERICTPRPGGLENHYLEDLMLYGPDGVDSLNISITNNVNSSLGIWKVNLTPKFKVRVHQFPKLSIIRTDNILDGEKIVAGLDDVTMLVDRVTNESEADIQTYSRVYQISGVEYPSNYVCAVFVNGIQQGSSKNFGSTGEAVFCDLSVDIPGENAVDFTFIVNTLEVSVGDTPQISLVGSGTEVAETGLQVVNQGLPVVGAIFELIKSGTLIISNGPTVYADIITSNRNDVDVLNIRASAADDGIGIKDLYLRNKYGSEFDSRADFGLYNESGQLLQRKFMVNGKLHFELANQDRINVPKNGSTGFRIKVDSRSINNASQTGKRLSLELDADHPTKGIEAITQATGADIDTPAEGWGTLEGENFVCYKSEISVEHANIQPLFQDPSLASQEFYRGTLTSDLSGQSELGRLTYDVYLSGMQFGADFSASDAAVKLVKNDGTIDNTANVGSISSIIINSNTSIRVVVDFNYQMLSAGESRTYSLLFANTENDAAGISDDDAVSISIVGDNTYSIPTDRAGQAGNIIWSDESDPSHSDVTLDWLNGYLIDMTTTTQVNVDGTATGVKTSFKQIEDIDKIELYPNPVGETLFVNNVSPNSVYFINNGNGQLVSKGKLDENIDVSNLNSGIYLINFQDDRKRSTAIKFLKK